MIAKAQVEAPHIAEKVRNAIKDLGGYRVESKGGITYLYEPEYLNVLYDNPHRLVIIELDCEKLPSDWTAELLRKSKSQAVFRGHVGNEVQALQVDHKIYLRVALPNGNSNGRGENGTAR
jgi:hypothetical protein